MATQRVCPGCAQSFGVPSGAPKLVACPWCGAAVSTQSPAVTAHKPAPRHAPVGNNGRTAPAPREEPPASSSSAWIVFLIIGLFGLLALGVIAIIGVGAAFLFRSAPTASPAPAPVVSTDAGTTPVVENKPNPDPMDNPDNNAEPKPEPMAPVPAGKLASRLGEAREKLLSEGGGNAASQAAVDKGLAWLVAQQRKDGAWVGDGNDKNPVGGTAVALLPLLGAGHGAKGAETKHHAAVTKGLAFLLQQQRPDGGLGANLYHHALATIALCEALVLTESPRYRQPAQKAIDFIARNQHPAGGWQRQPRQPGDTAVTAWHIQALRAAQNADLKVNKDNLVRAGAFLDSVSSERDSAYGLMSRAPSAIASAAGLHSRIQLGWSPRRAPVLAGIALLKPDKLAPQKGSWDSYVGYFATYLLFQVGGDPWDEWNAKTRDFLIAAQLPAGDWPRDNGEVAVPGGRHVCTSLALLTLEVYYRYPRPKVLVGD